MPGEYKCPNCNASIEKNVTVCGNCGQDLKWENGKPKKTTTTTEKFAIGIWGIGCLLPALFFIGAVMLFLLF